MENNESTTEAFGWGLPPLKEIERHFISNSPWSRSALIQAIQQEISHQPVFQSGAILVLDESAEQKSGGHSTGAARQHNGRLGKVEMSQVGAFLSLVTPRVNTWIDGELYLHAQWFTPEYTKRCKQVGLPETQTF
jgi:SRSO17 transposase